MKRCEFRNEILHVLHEALDLIYGTLCIAVHKLCTELMMVSGNFGILDADIIGVIDFLVFGLKRT